MEWKCGQVGVTFNKEKETSSFIQMHYIHIHNKKKLKKKKERQFKPVTIHHNMFGLFTFFPRTFGSRFSHDLLWSEALLDYTIIQSHYTIIYFRFFFLPQINYTLGNFGGNAREVFAWEIWDVEGIRNGWKNVENWTIVCRWEEGGVKHYLDIILRCLSVCLSGIPGYT